VRNPVDLLPVSAALIWLIWAFAELVTGWTPGLGAMSVTVVK
jgi:hypothetical protein